jgi:hypothetical protein
MHDSGCNPLKDAIFHGKIYEIRDEKSKTIYDCQFSIYN